MDDIEKPASSDAVSAAKETAGKRNVYTVCPLSSLVLRFSLGI